MKRFSVLKECDSKTLGSGGTFGSGFFFRPAKERKTPTQVEASLKTLLFGRAYGKKAAKLWGGKSKAKKKERKEKNRLKETQRTLDGAHESYGSDKPGMFRHVWQTSATMTADDDKRDSKKQARRASLLSRKDEDASKVEKRGSSVGASRRMSGLSMGALIETAEASQGGGLPPVRGVQSQRKHTEVKSERELLTYLDKSDRSPRPGWREEDTTCPYKEGHSLFRAGADGTGFVDKHAALWPDSLPPSMKRDFIASERTKQHQDVNIKPKWNRDPDFRPPTQCPVVCNHDEAVALQAALASRDDALAKRKNQTENYYAHEPFDLPELKPDIGTW